MVNTGTIMTVVERKQREKDQRRTGIIDAAERLFYRKGFDNVTMDEIATEVELSKGSLYVYFRNKDSLFFAIVDREERKSLADLIQRMERPASGVEKLRELVRWYIDHERANPAFSAMVSTYAPVIWSRIDPDNEKVLVANNAAFYQLLDGVIRGGVADGSVRDDIDPVMLGFYINMISMSVVWPLPAWKAAIARVGISFEVFLDNFGRFIEPAIEGCESTGHRKPGVVESPLPDRSTGKKTNRKNGMRKRWISGN
jgi:TetR/AcrR family transcriptional regulator